ncbi:MAG: hypothetical protein WC575_02640 [Patescibacteria group bacterium]
MVSFTNKNSIFSALGFNLLELVITISIFSLLIIAVGNFTTDVFKSNREMSTSLIQAQDTKRTVSGLVNELRTAAISSVGAYSLAEAQATSLTFYSNIDSDSLVERLRYFLAGTTLKRAVLKPSGNPLTYNPVNEQISDAVAYVRNADIFSYFDQNYQGTGNPLTFPVNISAVRLVQIKLEVDRYLNLPPAAFILTTKANLRNLKDNL